MQCPKMSEATFPRDPPHTHSQRPHRARVLRADSAVPKDCGCPTLLPTRNKTVRGRDRRADDAAGPKDMDKEKSPWALPLASVTQAEATARAPGPGGVCLHQLPFGRRCPQRPSSQWDQTRGSAGGHSSPNRASTARSPSLCVSFCSSKTGRATSTSRDYGPVSPRKCHNRILQASLSHDGSIIKIGGELTAHIHGLPMMVAMEKNGPSTLQAKGSARTERKDI